MEDQMKKFQTQSGLWIVFAALMALATLLPATIKAQTSYGSIVGTVTDSTGAVVPGATVTITNTATNDKRTVQSNPAGDFSFVSLLPSTYTVEVQKTTFKRFVRQQIVVEVNQTVRIDASMQVGAATETVEVTTETPLLQTDSATSGSVIEGKTVNEMPLNGRNTLNLLALAPGITPMAGTNGGAALGSGGHTMNSNWSAYSVGGGLVGQSAMYLDGLPMNVLGGGGTGAVLFVPTQDAIQEFHVATNASTSEFGRYSGGVVNMATKSGANAWHGTAYEYVRNNVLNANDWFNKQTEHTKAAAAGTLATSNWNKRAQWNQNQYGAELGGPIMKDKLFFMLSWEKFSARESSLQTRQVPTADMSSGIIDLGTASTAQATATSTAAAINTLKPGCQATVLTRGSDYAVQMNNGVMTTASGCFDVTALAILTEWPAPTPGFTTQANNFQQLSPYGSDNEAYIGRIDYNLSSKQRIFGRIDRAMMSDLPQEWVPGGKIPGGGTWHIAGGTTHNFDWSGVFGDTYTINPTTIADVRLSGYRVYNDQKPPTVGQTALATLFGGSWPTLAGEETAFNIPTTQFGASNLGNASCPAGVATCFPSAFANAGQYSWSINDGAALVFSLTKIMGQHNIKVGGETRWMDRSVLSMGGGNAAGGQLVFGNSYWAQNYWGNFLMGMPESATISKVRVVSSYNWYQGYYVNDTWEATHKITVNAGVRWELPGNIKEKHDNAIVLEPGLTDTTDYPTYTVPGTVALVNSSVYADRGASPARYMLFAPNLGVAYRVTDKDVIRAGYSLSYMGVDLASGLFPENFSINANTTSWNYATQGVNYSTSNPFPTSVWPTLNAPLTRSQVTPGVFFKNNVTAPVPTKIVPSTQQWNVTISHQFAGEMLFEASYTGSSAKGLPMTQAMNELAPMYWSDPSMPLASNTAGVTSTVTASQLAMCQAINGPNAKFAQCARPYTAYQSYTDGIGPIGYINYQALPARIQKRFKNGGLINVAYTWAKALGNTDTGIGGGGTGGKTTPQDWYNLRAEKSITSFSVPRRLVASFVYNLPVGKGQQFLNSGNEVLDRFVGGWTVNGIATFQDGFPQPIGVALPAKTSNVPGTFGATLRPNYTPGCNKLAGGSWKSHVNGVTGATPALNAACWSAPPTAYAVNGTNYETTVGNEPRIDPQVKAPGFNNWDLTLQKRTAITERINIEFRWEMFNAFNHERFGSPGTTSGNNTFGLITATGSAATPRLDQLSLRLNF
jgi:hypothetical protein